MVPRVDVLELWNSLICDCVLCECRGMKDDDGGSPCVTIQLLLCWGWKFLPCVLLG